MTTIKTRVENLDDETIKEIINDYATFEKYGGIIGDCELRRIVESDPISKNSSFCLVAPIFYVEALREFMIRKAIMNRRFRV